MRDFSELGWPGRDYLKLMLEDSSHSGWHQSLGRGPELYTKEKSSGIQEYMCTHFSCSLLWVRITDLLNPCLGFPTKMTCGLEAKINPFLPLLAPCQAVLWIREFIQELNGLIFT